MGLINSLGTTCELADVFSDASVLSAMLEFEAALARAQARLQMIPASAADAIGRVDPASIDAALLAHKARETATLAIPFVKELTAIVDPAAVGFVHWGATSQDLVDTSMVLLLRRARPILSADHDRLERALRDLSAQHASTVMAARTLLQPAPPITFGYKVAGWLGGVHRSWRSLDHALGDALLLQFGGASGTLASYGDRGPALASELAGELGLANPEGPWHTHRDRLATLVAHCGVYTGALSKIARDVILLMQDEVGEAAERGGGSSAMPNKRNPAGSVVALAAAGRVPGLVAAYLAGMSQEHERAAGGWQGEWQIIADVVQATGSALAAMADTVEHLEVRPGRMRSNLEATHGAVYAEKAVMLLAPSMGRPAAQKLVSEALQQRRLCDGLAALPGASASLTPEQIENIDRPEDYLGASVLFRRQLLDSEE